MHINEMYEESVQNPEFEMRFFRKVYKKIFGEFPYMIREDFCGTALNSFYWVGLEPYNKALAVDIQRDSFDWGVAKYEKENVSSGSLNRVAFLQKSVLEDDTYKSQIRIALNFSYFIFKDRKTLKKYFQIAYNSLPKHGLFIMDHFGGSECYEADTEKRHEDGFLYFWEQGDLNPVNNNCKFAIHFKPDGQRKIKNAFEYDWRLWSIPELTDILYEVGFNEVKIFFETDKTDKKGYSKYKETSEWEPMGCHLSYIVGVKE